jgi:error-prone DNA polymerase
MGFYAPAQIVRDAQEHGVEIRPVCINASRWDCTLEPTDHPERFAMRIGLRQVRGLSNVDAAAIVLARGERAFASVDDAWRRAGVPAASLVKIAEADGFRPSLRLERREALWAIKALRAEPLPLFAAADAKAQAAQPEVPEPTPDLKPMTPGRDVVEDYSHLGLTLRDHPLTFLREDLQQRHVMTCADATGMRDGRTTRVAGLVLVRQKPGSAKGVMFITIEDETGVANLVIWPSLYEQQRRIVLGASLLVVDGKVQREGEVVHIVATRLHDGSDLLASVGERGGPFPLPHGRGDEVYRGSAPDSRDARPKPRDIYIPDLRIDSIRPKTRDFR